MKKKRILISLISILVVVFTLVVLFTPVFNKPVLIYIDDTIESTRRIFRTDEIEKLTLLTDGNTNYFLNNLKYCNNLKVLTIDCSIYPEYDISTLSSTDIKEIVMAFHKWNGSFNGVNSLEALTLTDSDYFDCDKVKNLDNLKTFILQVDKIDNMESLSKLKSLEEADIYAPEMDLMPIYNIKSLSLRAHKMNNLEKLESMKNLEAITINYEDSGELSLKLFEGLPNLKSLRIYNGCKLKDSEEEIEKYRKMYESKLEEFVLE